MRAEDGARPSIPGGTVPALSCFQEGHTAGHGGVEEVPGRIPLTRPSSGVASASPAVKLLRAISARHAAIASTPQQSEVTETCTPGDLSRDRAHVGPAVSDDWA